ncbi:hypothetical protein RDABS01_007684 [Bienertia sinuspersici]
MAPHFRNHSSPFLFPRTESTVLPDPSHFFAPELLSSPLPTNSFFQNFVLKNGDQPEYIHPYLIRLSLSSLSLSYPFRFANSAFLYQVFNADFTISASNNEYPDSQQPHKISSFSDLSVTVDFPSSNLRFFLVRGSPFVTCAVSRDYDRNNAVVLDDLKYKSIDGDLVGVVGDSWSLRTRPISVTWHSIKGISEESYDEIIQALCKDVEGLDSSSISTTSSYFYGKLIARAARMALIAEEVCYPDVIPMVRKYLKETIEPWLNGTFNGNGFLYDGKWGGMVTKQGSTDSGADFGFGIYNDHHYHLGYFLYAIAVLAKIDPAWGRKYKPQAYSLMADFMNLSKRANSNYTRLRCFDLYKLHSWAGGLTEFGDGRNQESTSEAVNAYYSAALMGLAYGDTHLVAIGSSLAAMEMQAAETWWHVKEGEGMYEDIFSSTNKLVGVLWANKRDSGLWFAPPDWKECRLGIQVLPILPITEALFPDVKFVKDLVNWTMPALQRDGVGEGWKGFVYALEGIYDKNSALEKTRNLKGVDDGNSFSNLLWWIHSRDDDEEGCLRMGSQCWFGHYCH